MLYLLRELERKLGWSFDELRLLGQALTHPSYAAEQKDTTLNNQRMEFLGDAVLQLAISDFVYAAHPDLQEGELSKIRSALTNESALVQMARNIDLGPHLRLGRGEERSGGRDRASNLADTMEAVIAALYLDGGFEAAAQFIRGHTEDPINSPHELLKDENPKGALQEFTQEHHQTPPTYETVRVTGPDHQPEFEVRVCLGDDELAAARAGSRKKAEQEAAREALQVLKTHPDTEATETQTTPPNPLPEVPDRP